MKITPQQVGTYVSWTVPPRDTVTVRITSVRSDGISWVCADGYHEAQLTSFAISLDDIGARWRPATPAEAAAFESRYRPAPENWH